MTENMLIQNIIITDRLILEKIKPDDHDFLISLLNSKGWIENIGDRNIHSVNDAVSYIKKILETENFYYWVVRIKGENIPIGIVSFIKRSYLDHFDIGFALLPFHHGRGYGYEASKAVLSMVSKLPTHNIVLATTRPSNTGSITLLTKLGFRFEREMELETGKLHIYTNEFNFQESSARASEKI
ncbi:MAG TPA: GNAT family N-acetyltransferase [Puia sp.]|nr:GNAT family N-acetyltransferase [Puia sp.]